MQFEIKVPEVGESIAEGIIAEWKVQDGGFVRADEELFELETDKITMPVSSEHGGQLKILVPAGETVTIGQVVATVDTDAVPQEAETEQEAAETSATMEETIVEPKKPVAEKTEAVPINPPAGFPQARAKLEGAPPLEELSPAVRRLVQEHRLDPAQIIGTGKGGRITKGDVLNHLTAEKTERKIPPGSEKPKLSPVHDIPAEQKEGTLSAAPREPNERQTRSTMSRLRARVAERLVLAQQNAAILTTFNEVDMSAVMELRARNKEKFLEKYGVKLGIMSFFVKAVVDALKTIPRMNAWIDGDEIVQNHYYDIGVAVSTEKGLVVPVIRDAERLSFAEVELAIAELGKRARERTLTLDDLTGGVFTISNGGVFGSLLSTPILNPPQSGILGMHGIKKRPVVAGDDDHIEVRPMMYLAVSYDHRLIDGSESVLFLRRIVECVENPERIMLEI